MAFIRFLKKGDIVKYTCNSCKGTGIYKGVAEEGDIAVICRTCNGKGSISEVVRDSCSTIQDCFPRVIDGKTIYDIREYDHLVPVKGIKYVVYGPNKVISSKLLLEDLKISRDSIVLYADFLKGKKPLPIESMTCPAELSLHYGNDDFDNDCCLNYYDCPKEDKSECWAKFYGNAKTPTGKKIVLARRIKRKNNSK